MVKDKIRKCVAEITYYVLSGILVVADVYVLLLHMHDLVRVISILAVYCVIAFSVAVAVTYRSINGGEVPRITWEDYSKVAFTFLFIGYAFTALSYLMYIVPSLKLGKGIMPSGTMFALAPIIARIVNTKAMYSLLMKVKRSLRITRELTL